MPIHDWSQVDSGTFHDFYQGWTIAIRDALNSGMLPKGFFAMADQVISGPIPDVVMLQTRGRSKPVSDQDGGIALGEAPLKIRFITGAEPDRYAARAKSGTPSWMSLSSCPRTNH